MSSPIKFTNYLKNKREEFINDKVCTYYDINNGDCLEFAESVEQDLGGNIVTLLLTDMFVPADEYTAESWVNEYGDELLEYGDMRWSKKMLDAHGYPPEELLYKDPPNHAFIMYNNKYYDAEEINGVINAWDLPIFKRKYNWT